MENLSLSVTCKSPSGQCRKGKHWCDQKFLDLPLPKMDLPAENVSHASSRKQPGGGTPVLDLQSPVFVQLPVFCRLYMKSINPAVLKSKLQRFTKRLSKAGIQLRYHAKAEREHSHLFVPKGPHASENPDMLFMSM